MKTYKLKSTHPKYEQYKEHVFVDNGIMVYFTGGRLYCSTETFLKDKEHLEEINEDVRTN